MTYRTVDNSDRLQAKESYDTSAVNLKNSYIKDGYLHIVYDNYEFKKDKDGKNILENGQPVAQMQQHTNIIPLKDIDNPSVKAKLAAFQQKFLGTSAKVKSTPYYKQSSATNNTTQKEYKANGKTYTHADLLKMGYTEEQIQQAIKLGNLK